MAGQNCLSLFTIRTNPDTLSHVRPHMSQSRIRSHKMTVWLLGEFCAVNWRKSPCDRILCLVWTSILRSGVSADNLHLCERKFWTYGKKVEA
jgi:hypothetical protein